MKPLITFAIIWNYLSHQYSKRFHKMTEFGVCHFMEIFIIDKKFQFICYTNDKLFQIVPNGGMEYFINFLEYSGK